MLAAIVVKGAEHQHVQFVGVPFELVKRVVEMAVVAVAVAVAVASVEVRLSG